MLLLPQSLGVKAEELDSPAQCPSPAIELHHYLPCPVIVHKLELADVACPHSRHSSSAPCMLPDALPSPVLCLTSRQS